MPRPLLVCTLLAVLGPACFIEDHDAEFVRRLDDALDASGVSLAEAIAVPDGRLRNTRVVAGELDPWDRTYEADLWDGDSLLHAAISLDGTLLSVDHYGWNARAEEAAGVLAASAVTPYDAIEIAEDLVEDGRTFEFVVDDPWLEVELLVDEDAIYRVWISPQDGEVVDVFVEDDFGHHHGCPHVCW
jgi:hypothetical protein